MATPAQPEPVGVVLGSAAGLLRRHVGPVAWVALECLIESSRHDDGVTVSEHSVRGLAEALALSKDTVARALRRLAADGLIEHVAFRNDAGQFGSGHYRLDLPPGLIALSTSEPQPPRPARASRQHHRSSLAPSRSSSPPPKLAQHSLFDLEPGTS